MPSPLSHSCDGDKKARACYAARDGYHRSPGHQVEGGSSAFAAMSHGTTVARVRPDGSYQLPFGLLLC
jgi:hypothetical protein